MNDACTCFYRTSLWTRATPRLKSDKPERKDGSAWPGLARPSLPQQPKALFTSPGFFQTINISVKTSPHKTPPTKVMSFALFKLVTMIGVRFHLLIGVKNVQHLWLKVIYSNFSLCLEMPLIWIYYVFIIYLCLEYIHLYSNTE